MDDEIGTREMDTITLEMARERAKIIHDAINDLREGYGLFDPQNEALDELQEQIMRKVEAG